MKKLLKIVFNLVLILILLSIIGITKVDWEPLEEKAYYRETIARLENISFEKSSGSIWLAAWHAENVTPKKPASLVGYKPRGKYDFVLDSSHVKTLAISDGKQTVTFIGYPFMILHPELSKAIRNAIEKAELPVGYVYFTASHTHSGYGGHMKGLVSKVLYGGFDQDIVDLIIKKTLKSVRYSLDNMDTTDLVYARSEAGDMVRNRFVSEDPVDPYIRQLYLKQKSGKTAVLFSYSAHATTLSSGYKGLSGDYPFYAEQAFERKYDWALYAAGAVGSHSPIIEEKSIEITEKYGLDLYEMTSQRTEVADTLFSIKTATLPISMREPHFRISDNYRLKPWLFNSIIGPSSPFMDVVKLGNVLFISSSGEVSGVFYEEWEKLARQSGMELMLTTFNGEYIGYVPPDKYYDRHYRETRELNWYGPYNGQYFDELVKKMIVKAAE